MNLCRKIRSSLSSDVSFSVDFSLIGILAKIGVVLADNGISIFAVSTYNTDYVLIKKENYQKGLEVLQAVGYKIID